MSRISPQEAQTAADFLSRLDPNENKPLPIFLEMCRLTVTVITEVVPVRRNDNKIEVFLTQRPADDPNWPSMWHTPGTVVVPADNSREDSIRRIAEKELGNPAINGKAIYVGEVLHMVTRGKEMAAVYYLEITGEINRPGIWVNADLLPEDIVPTQVDFIKEAAQKYSEQKA